MSARLCKFYVKLLLNLLPRVVASSAKEMTFSSSLFFPALLSNNLMILTAVSGSQLKYFSRSSWLKNMSLFGFLPPYLTLMILCTFSSMWCVCTYAFCFEENNWKVFEKRIDWKNPTRKSKPSQCCGLDAVFKKMQKKKKKLKCFWSYAERCPNNILLSHLKVPILNNKQVPTKNFAGSRHPKHNLLFTERINDFLVSTFRIL